MRGKYESRIPTPSKHFSYVVTHSDMTFNLHDRKLNSTKGDKIEFVNVTKELGKELDLYYYYEKTIIGLCAQFIIYEKKYKPTPTSGIMQIKDSDKKYIQINNYAQK